jgi:hypothetical protein
LFRTPTAPSRTGCEPSPPQPPLPRNETASPKQKRRPGVGGVRCTSSGKGLRRDSVTYAYTLNTNMLHRWGPPLLPGGVAAPSRPSAPVCLFPPSVQSDAIRILMLISVSRIDRFSLGRGDWTCSGQKADRGLPGFTHGLGHECGLSPRRALLAYRRQMRHMIDHLVPYRTKWPIISAASP